MLFDAFGQARTAIVSRNGPKARNRVTEGLAWSVSRFRAFVTRRASDGRRPRAMEACEDAPRSSLDGPRGRRSPEVGPTWQGRREGAPRAARSSPERARSVTIPDRSSRFVTPRNLQRFRGVSARMPRRVDLNLQRIRALRRGVTNRDTLGREGLGLRIVLFPDCRVVLRG